METLLSGQRFSEQNLLSYRAKMTPNDAKNINIKINNAINLLGVKKVGPTITATFSVEHIEETQYLDMEILVPVSERIVPPEDFTFKQTILILNAVKMRYEGPASAISNSVYELRSYLTNNKLIPITAVYNVNMKEPKFDGDEIIEDMYVGISPNIL